MDQVVVQDGLFWQLGGEGTHDDHLGPAPHEANLEPVLRSLLGHDRVFLDVGAHVGHWTLRLARQARKVIAIEPNPATLKVLVANITLNSMSNVVIYDVAAWDEVTTVRLEDPLGRDRGGSTRALADPAGLVKAVPLDDLLEREPAIDLVKLDVEGADLHALRGMRATLARCRPVMLVERHDLYGYYSWEDLAALLAELGYAHEPAPSYMAAEYLIARPL